MTILIVLPLLLCNFALKWNFPRGINHGTSAVMQVADTDRDTNLEFTFTVYEVGPPYLHFYELHLPDIWEADSFLLPYYHGLYGSGDFDLDGFYDLVMMFHSENPSLANGIVIYESPDSFSYPIQEVWRDTVGHPVVLPISVYDIDQDMLPELIDNNGSGQPHYVWVYESTGNNQYDTVCTFSPMVDTFRYGINSTHAFGDFDSDHRVEFVAGQLSGYYWVFESPSNNTYQQVHQGLLSTGNIRDCFSVPDADGDGKLEFVVKGYTPLTARIQAFIFEATGDNTYSIIKSFDLFGGHNWYFGGYSEAGDVDGDSIPEIALEGCQNIYIIKAAGNDSFYVWETLPGNNGGSSVRVYDIDANGLSDVIISGGNTTRIFEYDLGIAETQAATVQGLGLEIYPNPFRHSIDIRYWITDNGQKCELKIYDINGRLVTTLSEQMSVSSHQLSVRWDGTDNHGNRLPAGVYFVSIQSVIGDKSVPVVLLR